MARPRTLGVCKTCGWADAVAKDECRPCYEYRRRTGEERPRRLWRRTARFTWERHTKGAEAKRLRRAEWWADYDEVRRVGRAC